jgi:methyl coenzyme M reductase gamma subunit
MPQYCQGKTHIADNRRNYLNPEYKLEKLRDIEEDDIVRLLAHRAPGEEYKSIHPPHWRKWMSLTAPFARWWSPQRAQKKVTG